MLKYNILGAFAAVIAATGASVALAQDEARDTIIHAGHLIAAPGEERVRQEVSIIVRGDEIVGIEDGFIEAVDADLVDLSDQWVMPGFIDAHVHITNQQGPGRRISAFTEGSADRAIDGVLYAGRWLYDGAGCRWRHRSAAGSAVRYRGWRHCRAPSSHCGRGSDPDRRSWRHQWLGSPRATVQR